MLASVWTLDSCEVCNAAKVLLVWLPTMGLVVASMAFVAALIGGVRSEK